MQPDIDMHASDANIITFSSSRDLRNLAATQVNIARIVGIKEVFRLVRPAWFRSLWFPRDAAIFTSKFGTRWPISVLRFDPTAYVVRTFEQRTLDDYCHHERRVSYFKPRFFLLLFSIIKIT